MCRMTDDTFQSVDMGQVETIGLDNKTCLLEPTKLGV